MPSFLSRIKDSFVFPSYEISEKREEEIIEKWAKIFHKLDLEPIAVLFASSLMPVSPIFGALFLLPASPFLDFVGLKADEYVAFFNKPQNLKNFISRLNELKSAKEKARPEDTALLLAEPWRTGDKDEPPKRAFPLKSLFEKFRKKSRSLVDAP